VHDLPVHLLLDARDLAACGGIHRIEQRWKGVAQAEAAAAAVADVVDALELPLERLDVVELRVAPGERTPRGSLEAPLAVCRGEIGRSLRRAAHAPVNPQRPSDVVQGLLEAIGMRAVGLRQRLEPVGDLPETLLARDRKSTRLNSSHRTISYAVFCLKKKKNNNHN